MPKVTWLLTLCFVLVTGAAWGQAEVADGTAAVVAKVLITIQDAHFYSALVHFAAGDPIPQPETGDALKEIVQKMALEEMVYAEMKSLDAQEGGRNEAVRAIEAQKDKGRREEWTRCLTRFGRTEHEAEERLFKSQQVERFLQKKVETLTPIVTDAEVDRYFAQNPKRFRNADRASLRPSVILLLKKQRMQKGLEDWVRVLKEKYGVTSLLNG